LYELPAQLRPLYRETPVENDVPGVGVGVAWKCIHDGPMEIALATTSMHCPSVVNVMV